MALKITNEGPNVFPTVGQVDARREGEDVGLIFGTKVEGQETHVLVRLTRARWEALKLSLIHI